MTQKNLVQDWETRYSWNFWQIGQSTKSILSVMQLKLMKQIIQLSDSPKQRSYQVKLWKDDWENFLR